jgi:rRNA maturation endonuclease Nob1
VNVPVILESCPACGGQLAEERVDFAYVTDLPTMPQPRVTQYRVWVCRCTGCGRKVHGEHPNPSAGSGQTFYEAVKVYISLVN